MCVCVRVCTVCMWGVGGWGGKQTGKRQKPAYTTSKGDKCICDCAHQAHLWHVGRLECPRLKSGPVKASEPGVALDVVGAARLCAQAQRGAAHEQAAQQVLQLLWLCCVCDCV